MDYKIMAATFCAVLLAELADKTQLVGMGLASKSGRPFSVWVGSVGAYIIVTTVSIFIAALLGQHLKPELIRNLGASLFILIGLLMFFEKI